MNGTTGTTTQAATGQTIANKESIVESPIKPNTFSKAYWDTTVSSV